MDSATATPPTTEILPRPKWAMDLRQQIDECPPERRLDLIADVFEMRKPSELPRPGECAHFALRDWEKLAHEFGMIEHAKTTHSYLFRHKMLRFITLSPAGTSSDVRGSMNAMSDFRSSYRSDVSNLLVAVDVALSNSSTNSKSFSEFKVDILLSMNDEKLPVPTIRIAESKDKLGLMEPLTTMVKYLRIIKTEFGISYDNVFKALNMAGDNAQKCLHFAKNSTLVHDMKVASDMVASVRDYLEMLRKEDRIAKEKKRSEREARNESKTVEPARVITAESRYQEDVARYGNEVRRLNGIIGASLGALADLPTPKPPAADYSQHEEKINRLTSDLEETEKELVESNDKIEALQQSLYESEMTNPWEGRMCDLVAKLTALLADNDITNLLTNLGQARKRLAEAAKLIDDSTKPTVTTVYPINLGKAS